MQTAVRMPPEDDEGSVEYKWRLSPHSLARLEGLATQMKFRLVEGGGTAQYYIGYRDDGEAKGLLQSELDSSLRTLNRIAESINATVALKHKLLVDSRPKTTKVADPASQGDGSLLYTALCEVTATQKSLIPLTPALQTVARPTRFLGRVAFVGRPGTGRTTLIGALVSETRDDGRGSLRFSTSKLVHEVLNGGTTCAATPHIWDIPSGRIELLDLPAVSGKYRKTLFKALVSKPVDLVVAVATEDFLVSDPDTGIGWIHQLGPRVLYVCSKADVASPQVDEVERLRVSTVTGRGLEEIKRRIIDALDCQGERQSFVNMADVSEEVMISVDSSWAKDGLLVVGGVLETGVLKKGTSLRLQTGRISDVCRVRDIRDEAGVHLELFDKCGRYCTLAIENFRYMEEVSTAASSSGEFLVQADVKRVVRPPLMLASVPLKFSDSVRLEIPCATDVIEGSCMVYWRGNRQEGRLERDGVHWQICLRKHVYVPEHAKLIIEVASRAVYVAIHRPS